MADRTAARRYAQAFLSLAHDQGSVERLGTDLETALTTVQAEHGQLMRALSNPVFTAAERGNVAVQVFGGHGLDLDPLTLNLLRLLIDRGRFADLPDVVAAFRDGADDLAGRMRVGVTTAEPLTDELAEQVRTALQTATQREILLDQTVDPSLIGGIVARVGGKVFDASIRARLDALKDRLIRGQSAAEA